MRFRALPLLGLLLAGPAFAYVTPGPMFEAPGRLFASGPTYNVVLEDVNLDGRADLVVGNSNGLAVALSTAAGGFGPFLHSFPELSSVSVSVGDFDGDGLPDVAGGYELGVYVGFGDGTGAWPASYVLPGHEPGAPVIPQVADLNGDGRSDLVEQNRDSTYAVYLGQGNRTLAHAGNVSFAPGLLPQAIAIGDVTGSSAPDLVVTFYETPYMAILPGNGDGTFGAETDLPVSINTYGVALGAADAGAPLDLFVHDVSLGIDFASGSGGGAFGSFSTLSGSGSGFDILLRDFNHDGKLDVVTYHFTRPYRVATFIGDGAGGFGPRIDSPELQYPLYDFVTGDVDGDGSLDLAGVQNPTFPAFALTRGHTDGTFGDGPTSPPRISGSLRGAAGDFDGDGKLDAMGWNDMTKKLAFARGHGDGTFDPIVESAALPLAYAYGAAGRFDGDANLDLVLVTNAPATLSFFHGNGNGTFAAPIDWAIGASPNEPTVVDLNGDGKLDVVVPCAGAASLRVFMQGPGGLSAPVTSATPAGPVAVRYADLNGDARLDRVLACTNQVVEQFDDGAGGWTTVLAHAQTPTPADVAIADVDEDGHLDAISNEDTGVTAFSPSPILRVLHGQPGGVFGAETTVNVDFDPGYYVGFSRTMSRLVARDLDEDGHIDLVGRNTRTLMYMSARGRGDGTFEPAESYIGPAASRSMDLADFDGDGHLDVLGCGSGGQSPNITTTFMVLRNRTGGVVGVPPSTAGATAAIALRAPFPNPARSSFTLRFTIPSREAVTVNVVSITGRRVLSRHIEPAGAGEQSLRLDGLDGLSAGVYAVLVSQGERRASTRVVVMP